MSVDELAGRLMRGNVGLTPAEARLAAITALSYAGEHVRTQADTRRAGADAATDEETRSVEYKSVVTLDLLAADFYRAAAEGGPHSQSDV